MPSFSLSYKILFNLELGMAGYREDLNQHISIVPDEATQTLYPYYKILPRRQKNTSVTLVQVVPDGVNKDKLTSPLENNEVFRLQVKFRDSSFRAATCLQGYDLDSNVIVLTNETNHVTGTTLLLTRPVDIYNVSGDYRPGYVVQAGGNFFKALKPSSSVDPHATTETDYWKQVADGGVVVSQADLRARAALTTPVDRDTAILIEVNHKPTLPPPYRLLDGALKCREVSYKINLLTAN